MFKDLTGQRFGRLVVVERKENTKQGRATWLCKCDCGNTTVVAGDSLRSGHTSSCDCLRRERSSVALSRLASSRTGEKNPSYKHGDAGSRLYWVWAEMIQRCINPKRKSYKNYGGRGIKVCDEWLNSFENFREWALANGYDYDAPKGQCTLDRINNNGNYEPSNCRWATVQQQNQNKRKYKKRGGKNNDK